MPANLTPQYHKAEAAFRQAVSPSEELRCLEIMFRELPKHKGTDKLQAELKQRISRTKKEIETSGKSSAKSKAIRIPRQGAGRVVIVGGPNAGKSQLIAKVTKAKPEVAPYPFTTREPAPAMMPFEDIAIQLIDTPPITADVLDPALQGLIRGTDLVLLLIDLGSDDGPEQLIEALTKLNTTKTRLGRETYLDETDVGLSFTRTILVANKVDDPEAADRREFLREMAEFDFDELAISAETGAGLSELGEAIFAALDVVRVYTKLPTAKSPDYSKPFTLRRGGTLQDVAELIHKDVAERLRHARVWGANVHDGSTVKADYVLHDKDVVEIHA